MNEHRRTYQREYRAKWRKRNPDYDHSAHYKRYATSQRARIIRRYGLTLEQYESILLAQHYRCLICDEFMNEPVLRGGKRDGRTVTVDHDHQTGEVRALLCTRCNAGIGFLGDSSKVLESATRYLRAAGR